MIERKSFPIAGLKTDETGVIEAIVSVFNNVDSGKEIVRPGFFEKSIARKLPKGVWAHDWTQPIAKTIEARELKAGHPDLPEHLKNLGGTYIRGQFNLETQRGREAYSDIKFGIVDEFSIGYRVTKDQQDEKTGARELLEGEWAEWSPVLVGMNDKTHLISIKSEEEKTIRKCDPEDMEPGKTWCLYSADGSKLLGRHATREECVAQERMIMGRKGDLPDGLTFAEHSDSVLAAVEGLTTRAQTITDMRSKEGRTISSVNRQRLQELRDALDSLLAVSEPKPKEKSVVEALRTESLRLESEVFAALSQST